jgi:hypothetical protein
MSVVAVRRSLRLGERYATAPELTSSRRSPFRSGCTDPGTDASVLLLGYVRLSFAHEPPNTCTVDQDCLRPPRCDSTGPVGVRLRGSLHVT